MSYGLTLNDMEARGIEPDGRVADGAQSIFPSQSQSQSQSTFQNPNPFSYLESSLELSSLSEDSEVV